MGEEMEFARVALFHSTLFPWTEPPGEYEHSVNVRKLLTWCMHLPGAYVGLNPTGIGRIIRNIDAKRQKNPSISEDQALDSVEAYKDDEYFWETDEEYFGPYRDQLFQYINHYVNQKAFDGFMWIDPKQVGWWPEATFASLVDYRENSIDIDQYRRLLNRHHCMLFAPFDIATFLKHLQTLSGADVTKYQSLISRITNAYNLISLPSPLTAYWSWELLDFNMYAGRNLYHSLLALWSDWPYSTLWAPPRSATYTALIPFPSHKAASFLENVLWQEIETVFAGISRDCGVPWRPSLTTFAGRSVYTPLFYFADPVTPPENADDYVNKKKSDIHSFAKICLKSDNLLSDRLAWGTLESNLVALRRERNDDIFQPIYLFLSTNSGAVLPELTRKTTEEDIAEVVWELALEERSIAVQAAEIDKERRSILARADIWSDTLDDGNSDIEEAIALLPLLGRLDRKRIADSLGNLYIPLRRLQALIEQTHAEGDELERRFANAVDLSEDTLRQIPLSSLHGVRNLRDALLDAYPYHYLKQPMQNLHNQMELLLNRSEHTNTALNTVLTEIARGISRYQELWIPRLGLLFTLVAVLIGLPTFIPQANLSPTTYPRWLETYLPLANVEAVARLLVIGVALATLSTLILYLLAWVRQFLPSRQDEVQRFLALVQQAGNTSQSTSDRNTREQLDEKAIQILATIWNQRKQEYQKRKIFRWLHWPFQSVQADDWLRKVRFNRNIINLSVLLPETIETILLPRTLCILRYKMQISGKPLISNQSFIDSLKRAGFQDDDIFRLDEWLTEGKNQWRIEQLNVHTFVAILKEHGVTALVEQKMGANWHGALDAEQAHIDLGDVLFKQEKYEEAITAYQKAIKLNPKEAWYYNNLGTAYDALEKYEEAINAYKKAIHLVPDKPYFYNNLANTYFSQRKFREAKQEYQRRIELSPDDALTSNFELGVILIHEGHNEAGTEHLQRAIDIYWKQANIQSFMSPQSYRMDYLKARIGIGDERAVLDYCELLQSKQIPLVLLKGDLLATELLASAPKPPPGIEQVVAILREKIGDQLTQHEQGG